MNAVNILLVFANTYLVLYLEDKTPCPSLGLRVFSPRQPSLDDQYSFHHIHLFIILILQLNVKNSLVFISVTFLHLSLLKMIINSLVLVDNHLHP